MRLKHWKKKKTFSQDKVMDIIFKPGAYKRMRINGEEFAQYLERNRDERFNYKKEDKRLA